MEILVFFGTKSEEPLFLNSYPGVCSACKKETLLSSYHFEEIDHIYEFIVLGRRKFWILDHCPVCDSHKKLSGTKLKNEVQVITETADDKNLSYRDWTKLLFYYQLENNWEEIQSLLSKLLRRGGGEAFDLFVSQWYGATEEHHSLAEIKKAHEIIPSPTLEQTLIASLIRHGEAHTAEKRFHEYDEESKFERPFLKKIAFLYVQQGCFDQAYSVFKELLDRYPYTGQTSSIRKEVRNVEKKLRITDSILPSQPPLWLVFAIPLLILFAATLWHWYQINQNQQVFVVNPFEKSLMLQMNATGQRVIAPLNVGKIKLPAGQHSFKYTVGALRGESSIAISTKYFSIFDPHVLVFDPSRISILLQITAVYSKNPSDRGGTNLSFGNNYLELPGIGYPFAKLPYAMDVQGASKVVRSLTHVNLTALDVVSFTDSLVKRQVLDAEALFVMLFSYLQADASFEKFALFYFKCHEYQIQSQCNKKLMEALGNKPFNWDLHMGAIDSSGDIFRGKLIKMYNNTLKATPGDETAIELLRMAELMQGNNLDLESTVSSKKHHDDSFYLCNKHYKNGEFEKAFTNCDKAARERPESKIISRKFLELSLMLEKFDISLSHFAAQIEFNPVEQSYHNSLIELYVSQQDFDKALKEYKRYDDLMYSRTKKWGGGTYKLEYLYYLNQTEKLEVAAKKQKIESIKLHWLFIAYFEQGKIEKCEELLMSSLQQKLHYKDRHFHMLLLSRWFHSVNNTKKGTYWQEMAFTEMGQMGMDGVLDILKAHTVSERDILKLPIQMSWKSLLYNMKAGPAMKVAFARQLSKSLKFPHQFNKKTVAAAE